MTNSSIKIEDRLNQLSALCDAVEKEAVDFKNKYGIESSLTRIATERFYKLKEMTAFFTQSGCTVMDYWLKEYGIEGGEN